MWSPTKLHVCIVLGYENVQQSVPALNLFREKQKKEKILKLSPDLDYVGRDLFLTFLTIKDNRIITTIIALITITNKKWWGIPLMSSASLHMPWCIYVT